MLKNIDKCGFYKTFDGKIQFSPKNSNPNSKKDAAVGTVVTASQLLEKQSEKENKKSTESVVKNITDKKKYKTTSAFAGAVNTGLGGGVSAFSFGTTTPYNRILDGIINEDDWQTKRKIYNDIYTYDLAGAVVDLISNLPYSEFNLVGIDDPAIIEGYEKAIAGLHLDQLMPAITTDYLVNGAFVGSLNWDDVNSRFTALMPHSLDDCEVIDVGIFGAEPIINLELGDAFNEVLAKRGDPRIDRVLDNLPDYLKNGITSGTIELNPATTMYIPRRGKSDTNLGYSYFNRILTIHLLEKALIKGTIETAQRRQRAIMHIQAGIEDSWEPTAEELSDLASYFQAADLDPISGIVVTRNGVNISDVKQGHDFWAWDETFDFATNAKMRALGVNEAILSGDASFNTLEAALSSFIDNIATIRNRLTQEVFTNKLFAITAYKNGYKVDKNSKATEVLSKVNPLFKTKAANINSNIDIGDLSQYQIPQVQWVKQLKPKADKDYLDILNDLSEKGIPISLRMFAAAGGENIDDLVAGMDDDNDLRLEIAEKKKELIDDAQKDKTERLLGIENIDEILPQPEADDDGFTAKLEAYTRENAGIINNKKKFRNLAKLDEIYGVREYDNAGHRRILTATRKKQLEDKIHKQMAEVLSENQKSI